MLYFFYESFGRFGLSANVLLTFYTVTMPHLLESTTPLRELTKQNRLLP